MHLQSFLVLVLVAISQASFGLADILEDDEVINLDGDQLLERQLRGHRRLATACWWKRISESYPGKDLKTCPRRKTPPTSGVKCGKETKTCFFDTQECPTVGCHPVTKCSCNGTPTQKGTWSCVPVTCPVVQKEENTTTTTPQIAPGLFYSSPDRAFEVQLNLLTPKVLEGYDNNDELFSDLDQAVRFYVNNLIYEQSLISDIYYLQPTLKEDAPLMQVAQSPNSPSAAGATDYQTNNQEEGVDESDLVKSDGIHVFSAYGDIVVIWNAATGKFVANYTLPPVYDGTSAPPPFFPNDFTTDVMPVMMRPPIYFQPKPIIQGMSLVANRLVLYVQGYGDKVRAENNITSAFGNAYDTRIVVLDTSTLPDTIKVVTQEDVQGGFRDARSIGNNIHLVTSSYINFYLLASPLSRDNPKFQGMNSAEYKTAATKMAAPLISKFVTLLKNDILLNGKAPAIPKIAIWQTDIGNSTNVLERIYTNGAFEAYVQLTSFSVQGLTGDLTLSLAGAFTPSSWGYTYAVDGNLVFAAQGWNWSPWWRGSSQTTYLLGFKLNGASATPSYLGSVDGYILNQYSLSVHEGHLRVATTVDRFWPVWEPVVDANGVTIVPQPASTTNNSVHVLKIPTGNETTLTEVTRISGLGKPNERLTAVRFFKNICYAGTCLQCFVIPGDLVLFLSRFPIVV